jgi:hypothetical protein
MISNYRNINKRKEKKKKKTYKVVIDIFPDIQSIEDLSEIICIVSD